MVMDPCVPHRSRKKDAEERKKQIRDEKPAEYFNDPEYRKLCEVIRQANRNIEHYERMKEQGVKF